MFSVLLHVVFMRPVIYTVSTKKRPPKYNGVIFMHTMYKYVLNLVIKISLMFAQYFEYYAIILRGPFFCGHSLLSIM